MVVLDTPCVENPQAARDGSATFTASDAEFAVQSIRIGIILDPQPIGPVAMRREFGERGEALETFRLKLRLLDRRPATGAEISLRSIVPSNWDMILPALLAIAVLDGCAHTQPCAKGATAVIVSIAASSQRSIRIRGSGVKPPNSDGSPGAALFPGGLTIH